MSPHEHINMCVLFHSCFILTEISTFAFFDLEATGLPTGRKDPRITELSCIAVHRGELTEDSMQPSTIELGCVAVHREELENPATNNVPRALNKLTMIFHPRCNIDMFVSNITGLCNKS